MKVILYLLIFMLPFYLGCHNKNIKEKKGFAKKGSQTQSIITDGNSSVRKETNNLNGIYYFYKSCESSQNNRTQCKRGTEYKWDYQKENGKYVIRLMASVDDYFLVINEKKSFASFGISFMENPITGWYKVDKIKKTNEGFIIYRSEMTQTSGQVDGTFKDIVNPYGNVDHFDMADLRPSYKIKDTEVLEFEKQRDEYYIDCKKHEKNNPNANSTILVNCYNQDLVWFKKIQ